MERILLRGARVLDPASGFDQAADVLIAGGKVQQIAPGIPADGADVIEAAGLTAAPGLVDMHVHLRDPGFLEKEDVFSGCKAAAAGGVTSLLAMPNTRPAMDAPETVRALLTKAQNADARVYTAACITKGLQSEALCDLAALKEAGAIALSDDGRPVTNTKLLAEALLLSDELDMPVVSHCEDLYLAAGGLINEGETSRALGVRGIPAAAEDAGTARDIALAEAYGKTIHICHVSTKTSVAMIRDAKRRGVRVTAETAPHYFSLTDASLLSRDADFRMNPPLRAEEDRLAVIEGLQDGTLDAVATDHAPHTPAEKSAFETAPNGSIGMETSLAAGITHLVKPGHLSLAGLLWKMSAAPAKILGINAGRLTEGGPADLVLFDPDEVWTVDPEALHGKSKNTPFKGQTLCGRVRLTLCRGKVTYRAE